MSTHSDETPPASAKQDVRPTRARSESTDSKTRISEAVLSAAHAVNRYYIELLTSRRSRAGGST